jgi:DNA-binding transcriptional ArsR family regulator
MATYLGVGEVLNVEKILRSPGRIRVLKYVLERGQVNITKLIRDTGLPHKLVSKYIKELEEEGIVSERRYGRLRIIEANLLDPKVSALKDIIKELESL